MLWNLLQLTKVSTLYKGLSHCTWCGGTLRKIHYKYMDTWMVNCNKILFKPMLLKTLSNNSTYARCFQVRHENAVKRYVTTSYTYCPDNVLKWKCYVFAGCGVGGWNEIEIDR